MKSAHKAFADRMKELEPGYGKRLSAFGWFLIVLGMGIIWTTFGMLFL